MPKLAPTRVSLAHTHLARDRTTSRADTNYERMDKAGQLAVAFVSLSSSLSLARSLSDEPFVVLTVKQAKAPARVQSVRLAS